MLFKTTKRARYQLPALATAVLFSVTCQQAMAQTATGALEPDQPPHLASHGGTLAGTAFPRWFADRNGVALELCGAKNDTLNACVFDPPIAGDTYSETLGFGDEAFWWLADTSMPFAGGTAQLVLGVEAAFSGGPPLAGDEFTFGRVRMRIDVPEAGTYKVTYPFGEETFTVDAPGTKAINTTLDTGTFAPDFDGPQKSRIGAFLVWPSGAPVGYVGDGATPHVVTGSPSGFNKFRVEKVGGGPVAETDQFVVSGRLFTGQIEALLESRRSTYDGYRLEVLATSSKDATVTASWGSNTPVPLYSGSNGYFYLSTPVSPMPSSVVITATAPNKTKAEVVSKVTDIVNITGATYNPITSSLSVSAKSSMYVANSTSNPVLRIEPFGTTVPADLSAEVGNIPVPPAHVKVVSSLGGTETKIVTIAGASPPVTTGTVTEPPPPAAAPVPNPDNATAIKNTPVVVNVLANDTDASGINPTSIVITTQPDPAKGTIGLIDLSGIQVKPAAGYVSSITPAGSPPDAIIFSYAVKDTSGAQSAPATVTVKVIGESLNVTLAEFRTGGGGWRIRGTSDALASNTVTATLNGTTIGSAAVDPTGAFDIRGSSPTPTSTSQITLTSSKGTVQSNIGVSIRK